MLALRIPYLRHIYGEATSYLRASQRRWAQVHDVRFVATHQQSDKVIEKYKSKLERRVKEEGLTDVNELKAIYQDKIRRQRQGLDATPISSLAATLPSPPPSPLPEPSGKSKTSNSKLSQSNNRSVPAGVKTLSSYIDVTKTLGLPAKEIEYIWRLRHASDPQSLCAVIPNSTYSGIEETARRHPQFILPLPREGQSAEIHFLQWTFPTPTTTTVLFTHLAEFKLRGEFSQPHTTITHHMDLAEPKGLVLLQGSVVEGRGVTVDEGKWLLMCLQKFYVGRQDKIERKRLLEQFSQGDESFKIEELLEEAEKIT